MWGFGAAVFALFPQMLASDPDLVIYLGTASIPPGPFYIIAGTGSACVVIGLLLKLWPKIEKLRIGPALTAPGRQSLTLYVAHILIGMGILEEAGLLNGSLNAPQIAGYAVAFCAASSIFALLWSRKVQTRPARGADASENATTQGLTLRAGPGLLRETHYRISDVP